MELRLYSRSKRAENLVPLWRHRNYSSFNCTLTLFCWWVWPCDARCPKAFGSSCRRHWENSTCRSRPRKTRSSRGRKPSTRWSLAWTRSCRSTSSHPTGSSSWPTADVSLLAYSKFVAHVTLIQDRSQTFIFFGGGRRVRVFSYIPSFFPSLLSLFLYFPAWKWPLKSN